MNFGAENLAGFSEFQTASLPLYVFNAPPWENGGRRVNYSLSNRNSKRTAFMSRRGVQFDSVEEPNEDIYLSIGSKVLEQLSSGENCFPSHHRSFCNPVKRLNYLLETPMSDLPCNWTDRVSEVIEEMSPADFALHGRPLIEFLLKMCGPTENQVRRSATRRPITEPAVPREFPVWLPTYEAD